MSSAMPSGKVALVDPNNNPITTVTNPNTGLTWTLGNGAVLTYEPGTTNEETIVVGTGNFRNSHPANATVISRGNPGPWKLYDPNNDNAVVVYQTMLN
jgi:hypothetical protein